LDHKTSRSSAQARSQTSIRADLTRSVRRASGLVPMGQPGNYGIEADSSIRIESRKAISVWSRLSLNRLLYDLPF
jgi:hypothetical protein